MYKQKSYEIRTNYVRKSQRKGKENYDHFPDLYEVSFSPPFPTDSLTQHEISKTTKLIANEIWNIPPSWVLSAL